jgi:hypothetical protein
MNRCFGKELGVGRDIKNQESFISNFLFNSSIIQFGGFPCRFHSLGRASTAVDVFST